MSLTTEEQQLITKDYEKNHSSRDYSLDQFVAAVGNFKNYGWSKFKHGAVIIVYRPYTADTVEFHCHNSGNGGELVEAVNAFNRDMQDTYWWSVTFYDNIKINRLLEYTECPSQLRKVDLGVDKTYEAMFKLRSK
jgi:hypothetical protein